MQAQGVGPVGTAVPVEQVQTSRSSATSDYALFSENGARWKH